MAKTEIKLIAKDQEDKTVSTTISDVNPDAQSSTLKAFAQRLNMLTTNTYERTDKVVTTDVDTATDKKTQLITLQYSTTGNTDANMVDIPANGEIPSTAINSSSRLAFRLVMPTDEDALPSLIVDGGSWRFSQLTIAKQSTMIIGKFEVALSDPTYPYSLDIIVTTNETITYAAYSRTYNLTIVQEGE